METSAGKEVIDIPVPDIDEQPPIEDIEKNLPKIAEEFCKTFNIDLLHDFLTKHDFSLFDSIIAIIIEHDALSLILLCHLALNPDFYETSKKDS